MTDFYRAFEDRHRGPRSLIKQRLQFYLPFLEALRAHDPLMTAIDLGCGRGEWLELLRDNGIEARGVDLDDGMLKACHQQELTVVRGDAIGFLRSLPDSSYSIISAFHLVEHIPFEAMRTLIAEALRVLKPAGLLILETPNTENLAVGTASFYLDPTHDRPIPPPLLEFATEFAGFARSKVVRLQEAERLRDGEVSLADVLGGVSPDYAVIAQKTGAENDAAFQTLFEPWYGVTLEGLATRYDAQQQQQHQQLQAYAGQVDGNLHQLEANLRQLESGLRQTEHRLATALDQYQQQLTAVYSSTSWRITRPLRLAAQAKQSGFAGIRRLPKALATYLLLYVGRRPHFRAHVGKVLGWVPGYRRIVIKLYQLARSQPTSYGAHSSAPYNHDAAMVKMTPRARQIYEALQAARSRGN